MLIGNVIYPGHGVPPEHTQRRQLNPGRAGYCCGATVSKRRHVRLMAMRPLFLGVGPDQVAALYNVSARTLSRWVGLFNSRGFDGLIEKPRTGRPRKISQDQSAQYEGLREHPEWVNSTHWTAKKFHGYLTSQSRRMLSPDDATFRHQDISNFSGKHERRYHF